MKASCPVGDVVDRVTILSIKMLKFSGQKRDNALNERNGLQADLDSFLLGLSMDYDTGVSLKGLMDELLDINSELWEIEDNIRICEKNKDFGPEFIELARSVYKTNDKRASLKRQVNELVGSEFIEEKGYEDYSD
jgi:hypothetical protein